MACSLFQKDAPFGSRAQPIVFKLTNNSLSKSFSKPCHYQQSTFQCDQVRQHVQCSMFNDYCQHLSQSVTSCWNWYNQTGKCPKVWVSQLCLLRLPSLRLKVPGNLWWLYFLFFSCLVCLDYRSVFYRLLSPNIYEHLFTQWKFKDSHLMKLYVNFLFFSFSCSCLN